jgi:hypothetical protein
LKSLPLKIYIKNNNSKMKKSISIILIILSANVFCFAQAAFQHPDGKYVKVNGAKLWIEIEGAGDALFLISGGPGNAHVGMHSFAPLKDSGTLVYIDNFGRGKSDTQQKHLMNTVSAVMLKILKDYEAHSIMIK